MSKHIVNSGDALKIFGWIETRGGIALWGSVDLSCPSQTWTCPFLDEIGQPKQKQSWQMADTPYRIITDHAEVEVHVPKEVRRFRVGVQRGSGFSTTLTDGGTRKVQSAVEKANLQYCNEEPHAFYEFDYDTQEAVIFVPDQILTLEEYVNAQRTSRS